MTLIHNLDMRTIGTSGNKIRFALFKCDICGTHIEKQKPNGLRDKSCGCIRYELSSVSNTIHGDSKKTSIYYNLFGIWGAMRDRCNRQTNQDYCYYGAKGIIVEPEWDNYLEFKKWSLLNGYVPKKNLQIDRIDGNKNYCSTNCRWVTPKVNQRNRDCVLLNEVKADEISSLISSNVPIADIAIMYGVHKDTINDIKRGKTWKI